MKIKTLTAFAAAAMLAASMSVASAQNPAGSAGAESSPSNLNKGSALSTQPQSGAQHKSGKMSKSGMKKSSKKKMRTTGRSKFCMTERGSSNNLNCKFASMAACTKSAKPVGRTCVPNPNLGGTTGAGTGMKSSTGMKKSGSGMTK